MIQTVKDLKNTTEEYTKLCQIDQRVCTSVMQKIYSSPHYIVISARFPGKTVFMYLGRGQKYEGLFFGKKNIPSKYRIRDRYIEFCRKYLQGSIIHNLEVLKNDRLLKFSLTKRSARNEFYVFWKGRESYFVFVESDGDKKRIFRSWSGWEEVYEEISVEEIFVDLSVGDNKAEKEAKGTFDEQMYFDDLEKNVDVHSFPKRKKKFFQRKVKNIETDLKKVRKWKDLKQLIEDETFVVPMEYKFDLLGIKFKFDKSVNEYKRRDLFYKKIKSFKKAEEILEKRLSDTTVELRKWINGDIFIVKGLGKTIEPVWRTQKIDKKDRSLGVNKKIISVGNDIKLAVGLDSKSNDWLRSNWAKKEDLWFHIDGESSSHVFLRNPKNVAIDANLLQLIGSVLKAYSQYTPSQVPLLYTQVKNLKAVKGAPGKVIFKKEKRMDIYYLDNWKERITIIS